MSDFNLDEYLGKLGEGVEGFDREAVKRLLAPVEARLKDTVLMRSDYSRNMDKVAKAQKDLDEGMKWLEQQKGVDYNNKEYVAQLMKQLEERPVNDPNPSFDPKAYLTPEQLSETLTKREAELQKNALNVMAKTVNIAQKFQSEFGKTLDIDEIYAKAQSEGKSLDTLYEDYAKPLREHKQQEEFKAALEKAKKDGYQEGLSKAYHPDPASSPKSAVQQIFRSKPEEALPSTTKEGRRALMAKALQEANQRQ